MRILVLGGTIFVGRHIVEAALDREHVVTLFHRGARGADLFGSRVERILGDRGGGLGALGDRTWDAIVDTSGYLPRVVAQSAEFCKGRASRYLFISTISVYEPGDVDRVDEDAPLATMDDPSTEVVDGATYGPLKALCERAVLDRWGDDSIIVRPGLIVGPHDPTDRFTYWLLRLGQGGRVLVPDQRDQPIQFIDVRDLAAFVVGLLESEGRGAFTATGPAKPYAMGSLMETMAALTGGGASLAWTDPARIYSESVRPWREIPLFLEPKPEEWSLMRMDVSRGISAGLQFTPLDRTVRDTMEWARARGDHTLAAGLKPEIEAELLNDL